MPHNQIDMSTFHHNHLNKSTHLRGLEGMSSFSLSSNDTKSLLLARYFGSAQAFFPNTLSTA